MLDIAALFQLVGHFLRFRYDIVLATTPKAILLGSIAAWLCREPRRIVFFRGRVYENFSGPIRWFYQVFDRIAAMCAHEVLFVSPSLMDEFGREGEIFARKGQVLGSGSGNGIDPDRFVPDAGCIDAGRQLREKHAIPADILVVLAVGRVCADKGIMELGELAALANSSNAAVKFVVVGPVESGFDKEFSRILENGNIVHVGFTEDVSPYFAMADVHLFLSHREGFGNVAVEAAAMGIPTIAYDVVGVRDSVAEGISGTRVPCGDVAAVWGRIMRILNDRESARLDYAGARKWALENFSRNHVWALFEDFYER
jgi:glycosyltransferase involved in cell wall biosynthesis